MCASMLVGWVSPLGVYSGSDSVQLRCSSLGPSGAADDFSPNAVCWKGCVVAHSDPEF